LSLSLLEIGPTSSMDTVLRALQKGRHRLEGLKIVASTVSGDSLAEFVETTYHLEELVLVESWINDQAISDLLQAISGNEDIEHIKLGFNRMKLRGPRLTQFLATIRDLPGLANKIVSLLLDENDFSIDDLQAIVLSLASVPRLRELSLLGNFSNDQVGIYVELSKLLHFPNIERLVIQGNDRKCLQELLIPFISDVAASETLQELDISGNQIGDQGLAALTGLIRMNTSLKVLCFDGSRPTSLDSVLPLLGEIARSDSLLYVPFPISDLYELIEGILPSRRSDNWYTVTMLKDAAEAKLAANRARIGVFSGLSFLRDKVLDELLDDITLRMQRDISEVSLTVHSAISDTVGVRLPFLDDYWDPFLDGSRVICEEPTDNEPYGSEVLFSRVREQPGGAPTVPTQFSSLLIRRPGIVPREAPPPVFDSGDLGLPPPTRMEDVVIRTEEEEEEEEEEEIPERRG
jgi:hypothetical protein